MADAGIITGKGDGVRSFSEDGSVLYYVQLLFKDASYRAETERNRAYGNELEFIPIPGSRELGFRQVERDSSYYIIYRGKGSHPTGYKNERVPSIELLLKIPRDAPIESIVVFRDKWVGQCKEAETAELGFVVKSSSGEEEISGFVEEFAIVAEQCSTSLQAKISKKPPYGWNTKYGAEIFVSGPVSDVLRLYSFLPNPQERGKRLEYENLAVSFH